MTPPSLQKQPLVSPVGLAMAGGAPGGAIYEIGAMRALDQALVGLDLRDCGSYVGVSAGAFLVSCLANGLSTKQQVRAIVKDEPGEHPFVPENFFRPAVQELGGRLLRAPQLLGGALRDYALRRERRLVDALTVLGEAIPVAVFDNDPIRDYVSKIFSIKGRTDDFSKLERQLTVVATDLETGRSMLFGSSGWPHVPISRAVQASTALPGLYTPVEIDGRFYVDGVLQKTMHASIPLQQGAKLVFCINPLVPVDTSQAVQQNILSAGEVKRRGLPSVLSQTVRTMIHSRMALGMSRYKARYPEADVILLEPTRDDYEDFFSNIFSFASRRAVVERAWEETRRSLLARAGQIQPVLESYEIGLDLDFLRDPERDIWQDVGLPEFSREERQKPAVANADEVVSELEGLLERVERLAAHRAAQAG
ncbi:MAG: patatin-like phospholipase family protein [Acidobacteriota bacterium]